MINWTTVYKELGGMKINVSRKVQRSAIRYEIQIATDKRFKKNLVKKLFLKDDDNLTIKYKKSGNANVRVRAYDKYGYVGAWSDVQPVEIR